MKNRSSNQSILENNNLINIERKRDFTDDQDHNNLYKKVFEPQNNH